MISLRKLRVEDILSILKWNIDTHEFLMQWSNFSFPLTRQQYEQRINSEEFVVFAIESDGNLVGTIQIFAIDLEKGEAKVGCYLLNPKEWGKGIGTQALKEVTSYAAKELGLKKLRLVVFDYNVGAKRCYEKVGFTKVETFKNSVGWLSYVMEKEIGEE